jgi:hypothetical protein
MIIIGQGGPIAQGVLGRGDLPRNGRDGREFNDPWH